MTEGVSRVRDRRRALARAVADAHRKAQWALDRGDTAAFHSHAAAYHAAANEHDALTGGSIRRQYDGQ